MPPYNIFHQGLLSRITLCTLGKAHRGPATKVTGWTLTSAEGGGDRASRDHQAAGTLGPEGVTELDRAWAGKNRV